MQRENTVKAHRQQETWVPPSERVGVEDELGAMTLKKEKFEKVGGGVMRWCSSVDSHREEMCRAEG
jgi:hypothetical protein